MKRQNKRYVIATSLNEDEYNLYLDLKKKFVLSTKKTSSGGSIVVDETKMTDSLFIKNMLQYLSKELEKKEEVN